MTSCEWFKGKIRQYTWGDLAYRTVISRLNVGCSSIRNTIPSTTLWAGGIEVKIEFWAVDILILEQHVNEVCTILNIDV